MPPKTHIHRYIRAVGRLTDSNKNSGFVNYYKCADSECSHYLPINLVLGKRSICNRCGKEFTLPSAIRMMVNRPHCKDCTRKKKVRVIPKKTNSGLVSLESILSELDLEE